MSQARRSKKEGSVFSVQSLEFRFREEESSQHTGAVFHHVVDHH